MYIATRRLEVSTHAQDAAEVRKQPFDFYRYEDGSGFELKVLGRTVIVGWRNTGMGIYARWLHVEL